MKKVICMIALAAMCFGAAAASIPVKTVPDTAKTKTKMTHGNFKQKSKSPHQKIKTKIKKHKDKTT